MVLVGYWPLNESSGSTAYDHSGKENHGTINDGGDSTVPGANGILGQNAYSFDGSNDYVRHPYRASKSFTATIWVKSDLSNWSSSGCIWSDREGNGFIIHPDDSSSSWSGYIEDSNANHHQIGDHTPNDITEWHTYAITHDNSSGSSQMFFDGRKVASGSTTSSRSFSSNDATLGHDSLEKYSQGSRPLDGRLQEARYYGRVLTSSEIQYLYQVGKRGRQVTSSKSS